VTFHEGLLQVYSELGVAVVQIAPGDDQIIAAHIRKAHSLAGELMRRVQDQADRPAGLWLERAVAAGPTWVSLERDIVVYFWDKFWYVSHFSENSAWDVSEAGARRIVEALGGEWPEAPHA